MSNNENISTVVGTHVSETIVGSITTDLLIGLSGNDTINALAGDDVIHGDFVSANLLSGTEDATSFAQYGESGEWSVTQSGGGYTSMTQSVETQANEVYSISFELAANYGSGTVSGAVEVLWNGEVISAFDTNSAAFSSETINFSGVDGVGELTIRSIEPAETSGPVINTEGPAFYYEKQMDIGGQSVTVKAFAEGQPNIYQVINGTLHIFDPQTESYTKAGLDATVVVNGIGFNVEDDLIYGIAVADGLDSLGNTVSKADLVMLDAEGASYRIGSTPYRSWTADFDELGNLWAFHSSMDRITLIDVDNVDANGVVSSQTFKFPKSMITDQLWDVAYNPETQSFSGVTRPPGEGQNGLLYTIDVSAVSSGGVPTFTTTEITGTFINGVLQAGMPAITFGAGIYDADGNFYVGGNSGDHDMDNSTGSSGGIYKVVTDEATGATNLELVANSPRSYSNDGTADPRAMDPFSEQDTYASVLIRELEMTVSDEGENTYDDVIEAGGGSDEAYGGLGQDTIAGQAANDDIIGGAGDDHLFGGSSDQTQPPAEEYYDEVGNRYDALGNLLPENDDRLYGGEGNDVIHGSAGHDQLYGGSGTDNLNGGSGFDTLEGGAGDDLLAGGSERDVLYGGAGNDDLIGGSGSDTLDGGAGEDTLAGGSDDDWLLGDLGGDLLYGGLGDDFLFGGAGDDRLEGSTGDDTLEAYSGFNELYGGTGSDDLIGGLHVDSLYGGSGDDELSGGADRDVLKGGTGNDTLNGGDDKDKLYGGSGDDRILGDSGSDYINGSIGDDVIFGGDGKDKILMGGGFDIVSGGTGSDWFVFNSNDLDGRSDTIEDYTRNGSENDRLDFRALSVLGDQSEAEWIAEHVVQNQDYSVTIELGTLTVDLVDHENLQFGFFGTVTDGLQL